ncbi:rCG52750 [Rattus norvegicus]|uniref:RCG52750 n=1 Tax=Rattus norvegicus TaxID=10116 RepID=A6IQL6_RAT|nr:rCG52750 [Rattus norvegicus]
MHLWDQTYSNHHKRGIHQRDIWTLESQPPQLSSQPRHSPAIASRLPPQSYFLCLNNKRKLT